MHLTDNPACTSSIGKHSPIGGTLCRIALCCTAHIPQAAPARTQVTSPCRHDMHPRHSIIPSPHSASSSLHHPLPTFCIPTFCIPTLSHILHPHILHPTPAPIPPSHPLPQGLVRIVIFQKMHAILQKTHPFPQLVFSGGEFPPRLLMARIEPMP